MIPFIDLQTQQEKIKPELDRRLAQVLAHGKYILGPEVQELEAKLAKMKFREDVIFTGRISTEVLQLVIASSEALVLVSFLEGFGIPVLQAMACGVPALVSDLPVLKEIAGEAALYFNPRDRAAMAAALTSISNSAELRQRLSAQGLIRAQQFSWEQSARETLQVLTGK